MARTRQIKPGFFLNEELVQLGFDHMILFAGLWVMADREGRLQERIPVIMGQVFPYSQSQPLERMLSAIGASGFIQRYEHSGKKYIQITNWDKHQNPHKNEAQSVIPPPPCTESVQPLERAARVNYASESGSSNSNSNTSSITGAHTAHIEDNQEPAKEVPVTGPPDGIRGF